MNNGGDAAEQVVRMSLEGAEFALKISGSAAKNIAALLYSVLKEETKTKGKARLASMLRSGKELKVFTVKNKDLKKFTQEAKKYGVLYCVLADRKNKDPNAEVDVIARAEDAAKINRIAERFKLASENTVSVIDEPEITKTEQNKKQFLDSMGLTSPLTQKTDRLHQSENTSTLSNNSDGVGIKPSVREELNKIKNERKEKQS